MKTVSLLFFVFLTLISFGQTQLDKLKYTLKLSDDKNRIAVDMVYENNTSLDTIELRVPTNYDRHKMTNTVITDSLHLKSKGTLIKTGFDTYQLIPINKSTILHYSIASFSNDSTQLSCDGDDYFVPAINSQFFHMYGDMSLLMPNFAISEEKQFDVELEWVNFPTDWHIANDFGVVKVKDGKREHQFTKAIQQENIFSTLFIGGNYRNYNFSIDDVNFHLYFYGKWGFEEQLLIDLTKDLTEAQFKLWDHFHHSKEYVISFTQKGTNCGRIGGRNMYDSFCFYLPGKFTEEYLPLFYHQLAHEYTHSWIGVNVIANNPSPGKMKWFTEGFTDYYANRVGLETGYLNEDQYLSKLNQLIEQYYLSPYRNMDIESYNDSYLFDERLENLAYHKGAVFAFYLDGYFREESNNQFNLDAYLKVLFSDKSMEKMNFNLTNDFCISVAREAFDMDISPLLDQYIVKGDLIPISSPLIVSCDTLQKVSFEYGFDYSSSIDQETIIGVKENSNAYKAGLRNGQKFLAINGMTNDPNGTMSFTVSDTDGEHTVEFNPKGAEIAIPLITKLRRIN
jgi:predicted metalloprotease with PDZ domain